MYVPRSLPACRRHPAGASADDVVLSCSPFLGRFVPSALTPPSCTVARPSPPALARAPASVKSRNRQPFHRLRPSAACALWVRVVIRDPYLCCSCVCAKALCPVPVLGSEPPPAAALSVSSHDVALRADLAFFCSLIASTTRMTRRCRCGIATLRRCGDSRSSSSRNSGGRVRRCSASLLWLLNSSNSNNNNSTNNSKRCTSHGTHIRSQHRVRRRRRTRRLERSHTRDEARAGTPVRSCVHMRQCRTWTRRHRCMRLRRTRSRSCRRTCRRSRRAGCWTRGGRRQRRLQTRSRWRRPRSRPRSRRHCSRRRCSRRCRTGAEDVWAWSGWWIAGHGNCCDLAALKRPGRFLCHGCIVDLGWLSWAFLDDWRIRRFTCEQLAE